MRNLPKILTLASLFLTSSVMPGAIHWPCPGQGTAVRYHSPDGSQISISVSVNHRGPYEFLVDTGAQISMIEPSLAAELDLKPQGTVGVLAVQSNLSRAMLVVPEIVEAGPLTVQRPLMLVQSLQQMQAFNRRLRGVLGENFLANFDLLIDRRHKLLCFDTTRQMQQAVLGERVPLLRGAEAGGGLSIPAPLLLAARLSGDLGEESTLLLDSGSNAPVLFAGRRESWKRQLNRTRQGCVAGNGDTLLFASMPGQEVRIGRQSWQIAFFALMNAEPSVDGREDGLLPTQMFTRLFISHADHFVVFEPQLAE